MRGQVNEPMIHKVGGEVKLTKAIVLAPHQVIKAMGLTQMPALDKRLNVTTESAGHIEEGKIELIPSYENIKPGSQRVAVVLYNSSNDKITLKKGTIVVKVAAANVVPPMLAPTSGTSPDIPDQGSKTERNMGQNGYVPSNRENITVRPPKPEPTQERLDKLFKQLDLEGISEWSEYEQNQVCELIQEYQHLFALSDLKLGATSQVKHEIKLSDPKPFKDCYQRIPPQQFEEVRAHLQDMLRVGAIHKSTSPWASPVVLVRKKDGSLRFCIDLHKLNNRTIKDAYSLPQIEESLDCLNGAKIFTSLDLKAGYWQVLMSEDSIPYTAFTVGPLGFLQMCPVLFGLTNAPATFQRLMESCLGDLHLQYCIIYLDDIIVFSKTPEEHIERLRSVFQKLDQAGLHLKPSKCEFFKKRVEYLGHIVSENGIETNPKKIKAIVDWPQPQTVTQMRSFLGFCNYYRKFIHQYAQIAKPLYKLISGNQAKMKRAHIAWNEDCERAFKTLKGVCSRTPVLAYANYSKSFSVHTDASELGLGAVLYQAQNDGTTRVIAFASRSLLNSEQKYHSSKLEFLALKWAIHERFHEYLYGSTFDVYTDNNPLTYIMSTAKLDATAQ